VGWEVDQIELSLVGGNKLRKEDVHPTRNLVPNAAYLFHRLPGRVWKIPIKVALPRIHRTCVSTPHSDHDIGCPNNLVSKRFGELLGEATPTSFMASTTEGLIWLAGVLPAERT
jgi:hypothetical protein